MSTPADTEACDSALDREWLKFWAKHRAQTVCDRDHFVGGWQAGIESMRFMSMMAARLTMRSMLCEDLLREALTVCSDGNAADLARRIETVLADAGAVKVYTCTLCGGTVDLSNPVRPTA